MHKDYYSLLCERSSEALTKAQTSERRGHAATMGTPAGPCLLLLLVGLISVTAKEDLMILPSVSQRSVFQGSNFFFSCKSEADNVQRIMWTGPEGKQITDYQGRVHVEEGGDHKGVELVFENILRQDRGTYTCSANVDGKEVSKSFELFVDKEIDFLDTPRTQYLEEGFDSRLLCDVTGDPVPTVSWTFEGKKISYGDKYSKPADSPNSLIVGNVTLEDAGQYVCKGVQVSTRITEMKDFNITVKVHHKPLWNNDDKTMAYSFLSGKVNLTCEVQAEPEANFTWTKDKEVMQPSNIIQIFNNNNTSILQLTVEDEDMFGDYLCEAQNKLGRLVRVIILQEGAKPAVPTAEVVDKGVDTLHLDLDAKNHPDMPIVGYKVQFKEVGEDWTRAQTAEFKKGSSYVLRNLKNDTPYVMRAAAQNAAGYSEYSVEISNRTDKIISSASTSASFSISSCVALLLFLLISASLL